MDESFSVEVEEKRVISKSWFSGISIVYCGMPSEKNFSIAYIESSGNVGFAMNLYFPSGQSKTKIKNTEFMVLSVSSERIALRQIK